MLKNTKAFSSFSTSDVTKAKEFYDTTLGIETSDMMGGIQLHFAGENKTFIYPKPDHVPATFTVLNFLVADIDKAVDELTQKGVTFEHYDQDQMKTDEKVIARGDGVNGPSIAWFKDPAGNFLSIIEDKN